MSMLDASTDARAEPSSFIRGQGATRLRYVCIGVILIAAQMPLLLKLFVSLWQRPQYQFFPIVLVGAAYIA